MKTYHDIEGDGGSNILGQVIGQHQAIADSLRGVKQIVAVGSGKGGVGKSTVTMALAQALRRRGRSLAILDADFNGPCQAHLSGLRATPWIPGERGLLLPRRSDGIGVVSFGSLLEETRPIEFASVAKGDEYTWRATREFTVFGQLLAGVEWGELDFLVLDLPPGTERTLHFADFLGARAAFVLVTIPSDLSRGVVARSISALTGSPARALGYVENMAGYYCRGCDEIRPLFPASQTPLDLPCLGRIPFDPELAELCDRGWSGESPAKSQAAVEAVTDNLLRALET